ncbi:DNA polymerase IV [Nocardioides humilatus]|uniref:DNA polymerase IV n=1 Tax=Nocardioides humilatus TaxID=2607660 RepID=A0A5B1LEH6_9ACTN|nr:DNA polymerase IV [Nocardioides humilatus]KAA1419131.1 DNA polymerase IV [Nocardioides humilatus]
MTGPARWVLHVDLDQFIAAVEVLRRPELAGKPVVVGGRGNPTERGVVATASYEARSHGVGSGMPLRTAAAKFRKAEVDAVFLPVDAAAYDEASATVMGVLRGLEWGGVPVLVEALGWDEAFVGAGPDHGDLGDPSVFATHVREVLLEATQLRSAVGIGDNKLQAKLATGFAKQRVVGALAREAGAGIGEESGPGGQERGRGTYVISDATWYDEMGARPTTALWGIGKKTADKLAVLGLETVDDLARSDPALLATHIGPTTGPWLRRLGRGVASDEVDATPYVARGHGREETFQEDLADWSEVEQAVDRIARRVVADIEAEGRSAVRVELKIRFRPFFTFTRSHKLKQPTSDPDVLAAEAVALLDRVEKDRAVRLLGVRLEMTPPDS